MASSLSSSSSLTATASSPLQGFQTLVSNLHPDVTLEDVMELFGDVGPLKNARLVKPGVADVVFVNVEDALAAVKTYHMRLLDGQPMSVELKFEPSAVQSTTTRSKPVLDLDVGVMRRALFKTMTDVSHRTPVSFTVQV